MERDPEKSRHFLTEAGEALCGFDLFTKATRYPQKVTCELCAKALAKKEANRG